MRITGWKQSRCCPKISWRDSSLTIWISKWMDLLRRVRPTMSLKPSTHVGSIPMSSCWRKFCIMLNSIMLFTTAMNNAWAVQQISYWKASEPWNKRQCICSCSACLTTLRLVWLMMKRSARFYDCCWITASAAWFVKWVRIRCVAYIRLFMDVCLIDRKIRTITMMLLRPSCCSWHLRMWCPAMRSS